MRDLVIRSADAGDVKAIAKLHVASWKIAHAPIMTQEHLDWVSEKREIRRTRKMLKDGTPILVAERAGEIVGFMVYGDSSEEETDRPGAKEISSFWVHHQLTRQGIGTTLLKELKRRESPQRIYVWVLTGVDAGPAFYKKHGFQPEEETGKDFIFLDEQLPMVRFCKTLRKPAIRRR